MYVFKETDNGLYTVGFYTPSGEWIKFKDYATPQAASAAVHYLNGGNMTEGL